MSPDLNPNLNRSLTKVEKISQEDQVVVWNVINNQAILYAYKNGLDVTKKDDHEIALNICANAFNRGAHIASHPEDKKKSKTKFAQDAVKAGLDIRAKFLTKTKRVVREMTYVSNKEQYTKTSPIRDFGIEPELIQQVDSELRNSSRLVTFPKSQEILNLYTTRNNVLATVSRNILITTSGLDTNNPEENEELERLLSLVDSPSKQAIIARGYLSANILTALKSKSEFSPNFISHEALIDLISNYQTLVTLPENQRFVFVSSLLMNAGVTHEELPETRELFLVYFDQLLTTLKKWQSSTTNKNVPPTSPAYWSRLRQFFIGYPIDPTRAKDYFNISSEAIAKAHKDGSFHLWRYATKVEGYWVPSPQDLAFAREILRNATYLDALTVLKKVKMAEEVWRKYSRVKTTYPGKIVDEQLRIAQLKKEIETMPTIIPSLSVDRTLNHQISVTNLQLISYQKSIDMNNQIGDYFQEAREETDPYEILSIPQYQELLLDQLKSDRARLRSSTTRAYNTLTDINWLHMVYPIINQESLDDRFFLEELNKQVTMWKMEMMMDPKLRVPSKLENTNLLGALLETKRANPGMKRNERKAIEEAIRFLPYPELAKPLRAIFTRDVNLLSRRLKVLLTHKERSTKIEKDFRLLNEFRESDDEITKKGLAKKLEMYTTKERVQQLRASYFPPSLTENHNLLLLKASLAGATKLNGLYFSAVINRYFNFTIPPRGSAQQILEAEKEKLISSDTRKLKKFAKKSYDFLDQLSIMVTDPLFEWDLVEGLSVEDAMMAIKQKIAVGLAITNKDKLQNKLYTLERKLSMTGLSEDRRNAENMLSRATANLEKLRDESENAERYLVEAMSAIGFALPLDTFE